MREPPPRQAFSTSCMARVMAGAARRTAAAMRASSSLTRRTAASSGRRSIFVERGLRCSVGRWPRVLGWWAVTRGLSWMGDLSEGDAAAGASDAGEIGRDAVESRAGEEGEAEGFLVGSANTEFVDGADARPAEDGGEPSAKGWILSATAAED